MDKSKMNEVQKLISDFAEALIKYEDGMSFVLDIPPALLSEKSKQDAYRTVRVDNVKEDMKARCKELNVNLTDKEIDDYSTKLVNCDYDLNNNYSCVSYSEYLDRYIKSKPQDIRTKLVMSLKVYREDPETQELKPETWYYWKSSEGLYSKDITTEEGKQMHISLTKEDVLRDWKSANVSKDFTGEMEIVVPLNEDLVFEEEKEAEVEEIEGR